MKTKIKQIIHIRSARFCLGCLFAAAAFAISLLVYGKAKAGLFFAVLFLLAGAVKLPDNLISRRGLSVLYVVWLVFTAFVTLVLSQFCQNEALPVYGALPIALGILLIITLFLIPLLVFLHIRAASIIVSALLILFSCLNYFVYIFRGSAIAPADLLSVVAAGNVAAEYSFRIPSFMFYALVLSGIYYFFCGSLPHIKVEKRKKTRLCCASLALVCAFTVWLGGMKVEPLHWLNSGAVGNGFLLNFTVLFRESFPQKPDAYSADEAALIAKSCSAQEKETSAMPDIIVVMDESFADLSKLGNELKTDIPVTPFVDNLKDHTLRGYTLSSVFGGGTPNSEYEFLTGNSFLFLPTGSIAYQQFIKEPCYSMASELKSRGYSTVAMHQYLSNSWMRDSIWPLLGFEECIFLDDFPQKERLRDWGTDHEMFQTIASVYEEHTADADKPIFIFGVTIQNHGSYSYEESDFQTTVHLQGYSSPINEAEQYLTCIHETDEAVEWLIRYFEQVDRDVVILFYGDHFPRLSDAFFEEVHGGPYETLDERMLQYEVPFFIWTNYPSESEEIELVSMNYLAGLLYQRAGLELPPYNRYLEELRQTIPACNAFGYYSKAEGAFLPLQDARGEEKQALWEYNILEWNCLFDKENRNEIFFPAQ